MAAPAIQASGLRARVHEKALLDGRCRIRLEGGRLRISEDGLRMLIPPGAPVALQGLAPGRVVLQVDFKLAGAVAEIRLFVTPEGRLGLELGSVEAGILPVPSSLAAAVVRELLPEQPWLRSGPGARWEVDFAQLAAPAGLELPPLAAARAGGGAVELEFARAPQGAPATPPPAVPAQQAAEPAVAPVGGIAAAGPQAKADDPPEAHSVSAREIESILPRALAVTAAPAPGQPPEQVSFSVQNPAGGILSLRFRARPAWVRVDPSTLSLPPGASGTATVEIDPSRVTRENHRSIEVIAGWSLLETEPTTGQPTTRGGECRIPVDVPPPRRLFTCPDAACGQFIFEGDAVCSRCRLALRYCPECGHPAAATAPVCSGPGHHPLTVEGGWPVPGGSAARAGGLALRVAPPARLAWRYQPADAGIRWTSPAIAWGLVFLAGAAPGEPARLVALDLETGVQKWQASMPGDDTVESPWAGPCAAGASLYAAARGGHVVRLDAATGRQRWAARVPHRIPAGCLAAGNALFLGTATEDGEDGHLLALWPEDGERVWSTQVGGPVEAPLAAHGGRLYACCRDEHVYALAAGSGEIVWQQPAGGPCIGGPVVNEGLVICGAAGSEILALDAATGEPRWRQTFPGPLAGPPAVYAGRIYPCWGDRSLSALSTAGEALGSVELGSKATAPPLPLANGALITAADGGLYFTDGTSQVTPLLQGDDLSPAAAPLAASGQRVIIAAADGTVCAIDLVPEG
jgi:outer membrane protein assembly factor BamB